MMNTKASCNKQAVSIHSSVPLAKNKYFFRAFVSIKQAELFFFKCYVFSVY